MFGAAAQRMGKEAAQSRQPIVAGCDAVVTVVLEVLEEVDDQFGIEIGEPQLVDLDCPSFFDILEK